MEEPIINKVAESGLITLDLESFYPGAEGMLFDLKDFLFKGMILKEKDFREALKSHDWEKYRGKMVAITCSADAIIPVWAYMLLATYLEPVAEEIIMGNEKELHQYIFLKNINALDAENFRDQRVIIKGCGDKPIGEFAYMEITKILRPVAKSIMYGEPCSTVPVYKKSKPSSSFKSPDHPEGN